MAASLDLPYIAEYAKSGRAACKSCKDKIDNKELRLGIMVQSPHFDGKIPLWHHMKCFFTKQRPNSEAEFGHFDSLRFEDQEKLKKMIGDAAGLPPPPAKGKRGKKGAAAVDAAATTPSGTLLKDFSVEYAKSNKSVCGTCEANIVKDTVRVGKMDYASDASKRFGPHMRWHHLDCFKAKQAELEFFESGEKLVGFKTLEKEDREKIRKEIKPIAKKRIAEEVQDVPDAKKVKKEDKETTELEKKLKEQSKEFYKYRDWLERHMKKKDWVGLLEYNKQEIPEGNSRILDRLADNMAFGRLLPCTKCGHGQLVFTSGAGYICQGDLSEWTKCNHIEKEPKREKFKIPIDDQEEFPFLKSYKCKVATRVFKETRAEVAAQTATVVSKNGQAQVLRRKPLDGWTYVVSKKVKENTGFELFKNTLMSKGAKVLTSKVDPEGLVAVVAEADEVNAEKPSSIIRHAKDLALPVLTMDFMSDFPDGDVKAKSGAPADLSRVVLNHIRSKVNEEGICGWDVDFQRLEKLSCDSLNKSMAKSAGKSSGFSKGSTTQKLKVKGGSAVDPESGLDDVAVVYKDEYGLIYNTVLSRVDVAQGTNSFYKMQILTDDSRRKFWVFRSWGRIGTNIGKTKLTNYSDAHSAISEFSEVYEEKTGDYFTGDFQNAKKVPGKFFPLVMDHGGGHRESEKTKDMDAEKSKSSLPMSVKELVSLIFSTKLMKETLHELEIDLKKMPLGNIDKSLVRRGMKVLKEADELLKGEEDASNRKNDFIDVTNRFFSMIPHDFGMNQPPLICTRAIIQEKEELCESLLEMEYAMNLLNQDTKGQDRLEYHYNQLNNELKPLDKSSDEFQMLAEYVKNTHAATHRQYSLEIEDVFTVNRKGEKKRYRPFEALHNKMLLWHGSRITNYAGILSKGLRIAPPEAPVTGYMFGKGIYFADMVSKSANYCCTTPSQNTGLMLLSEVALGNMDEQLQACNVQKLPSGKHSVKGLGKTAPDESMAKVLASGVKVPLGKPTDTKGALSSLLYNEYIVYDEAQVLTKYLLKLKFKYD
ncbi:unnamed protein product [Cyprideis torosa]|uniref:Uncharacterized protein n=1 Tax=Cyprideis torosa TaxID=163714 RepID=A0A7R8ZNI4_9CRUS|nr:unnamed protein product [Cyprideis torosa]CAG0896409.1 unnamed protein product [Cyprideis torosa]